RFDLYSESNNNRCGVTDIVSSDQEHVLGVLYRVPYRLVVAPRGERSPMDKIEGAGISHKSNYMRKKVVIRTDGKAIKARTYVGTAAGRKRFLRKSSDERRVSRKYFGHLLAGAERFQLPAEYVDYVRRQAGSLK